MPEAVQDIRRAAVAGKFYPGEPAFLSTVIDRYLAGVSPSSGEPPKAIIAPHAGLIFSGSVAAEALAPWRGVSGVHRVVICGPSHYFDFPGIAISEAEAFETPLGQVEVGYQADILGHRFVRRFDAAHLHEHSIEALLPFVQRLFGSVRLTPLIIGDADASQVAGLLNELWGGSETRLIISSELSQNQPFETAKRVDDQTAGLILNLEGNKISADQACGFRAIRGLLKVAAQRELSVRCAAVKNSGETAGEEGAVTGFGAFHFYE